jgi:hypothetical protein
MLALDVEAEKLLLLNNYWRADVDGTEKEGNVYALLESKGVSNIAPFGRGNDLPSHMTLTYTLRHERWACWSREMVYTIPSAGHWYVFICICID